jgi:hypothetical protein
MATISQIFLHDKNQQPDEIEPKQQRYTENTRCTLKRRPQHIRKTKSNIIKTPRRLKQNRNTDTQSLTQCMTNQRCLH